MGTKWTLRQPHHRSPLSTLRSPVKIIVTSHFPLYHQLISDHLNSSLAKYMGMFK